MRAPHTTPTPGPTKLALVLVLLITGAALARFLAVDVQPLSATAAHPYLVVFAGLFFLRVIGQLYVRARRPAWLPPTEQWNLSPYVVLLPTQVAILGLMTWINLDFGQASGFWTMPRRAFGVSVLWFAGIYASVMAIRYVVRMTRRPEQRWFGGTIPIFFHWVLAAYLFVLGTFHASR